MPCGPLSVRSRVRASSRSTGGEVIAGNIAAPSHPREREAIMPATSVPQREAAMPATSFPRRPQLSFMQILNMNVGFFGIQYSFGLQQSNMSPIYRYLGANEASLPLLWLAGPMTGLLVQPLIGAMSDRTLSPRGRRTPDFLVGAVLCSIALLWMPFSSA